MIENIVNSSALLLVLLNPFLMSIYLMDLIQKFDLKTFSIYLLRGTLISAIVFIGFAWTGETVFKQILQVRFESFLIFGGIIFLIIGLRFFFGGSQAIGQLRGQPRGVAITIAMPYMIGPGTVSASVIAGSRLSPLWAAFSIIMALIITVISIIIMKGLHDYVRNQNEAIVERYIDIAGRTSALVIGTFAIDMIMRGIEEWFQLDLTT
ncbi:MarC family protein [Capilliphycus salinus ALCB114379]|uniref:MarC family protein n=1 Tax=Capilliphycus salinus TaxID=2768948 RepID=UPI0039A6ECD3